jgi:tetratricopeptide (TPR) repeat protein
MRAHMTAYAYFMAGRKVEAKTIAEPIHRRLHAFESLQRWDDAINDARWLTELEPHVADRWIDLGDMLHAVGRYDEATSAYKHLAQLDPAEAGWRLARVDKCTTGDVFSGMDWFEFEQAGEGWGQLQVENFRRAAELETPLYAAHRAQAGFDPARMTMRAHMTAYAYFMAGRKVEAKTIAEPIMQSLAAASLDGLSPPRRAGHLMNLATFQHLAGRPPEEIRTSLDKAYGMLDPAAHGHIDEYHRRQIAMYYALTLDDGDRAVEILRDALRYRHAPGEAECAWKVWRYPLVASIRDHEPFRELMRQHGVDVDRSVWDYPDAPPKPAVLR